MKNLEYHFYKDWIFINFFNVISVNWEKRKIMKAIKGVFIPLELHFKFTKDCIPFMFCSHYGKFISISIHDVQWKDKWRTPRHEENPFVSIGIFNKWFFNWTWKLPAHLRTKQHDELDYWEQALWYLYYASYNKKKKDYDELDINKAREKWPWTGEDGKSTWNDKFILK